MSDGLMEIFTRDSPIRTDDVDFKERIIDVIAVPYEEEAEVPVRTEIWREVFERGAFDGIEDHAGRVPVNREHTRGLTVGKIVKLDPYHERGLFARIKVANTDRGNEALQLAAEDMIGASIGYFIKKGSDVASNRRTMLRRVKRAFLDHLSLVESPAYAGALVDAVREGPQAQPAGGLPPLVTPNLDELLADDVLSWAASRVSKQ